MTNSLVAGPHSTYTQPVPLEPLAQTEEQTEQDKNNASDNNARYSARRQRGGGQRITALGNGIISN